MPTSEKRALAHKCWRASKFGGKFVGKFVLPNLLILSAFVTLTACLGAPGSSASSTGAHSRLQAPSRPAAAAAKPAPQVTIVNGSARQASDPAKIKTASAPSQVPAPSQAAAPAALSAAPAPVPTLSQAPVAPVTLNVVLTASDYTPALAGENSPNGFNDGFMDWKACVKGFAGNLATSQAGQTLLADNGLLDPENALAPLLAPALVTAEVQLAAPPAPSAGAPEPHQNAAVSLHLKPGQTEGLLVSAYEQAGRHYRVGGQAPATGFDAAGFTRWVYGQRGIHLPTDARKQAAGGRQVAKDELRPGDLLIFRDPSVRQEEYHVGIYTGQGNFIHAAAKAGLVTETDAFGPQYSPYFLGARRYFDDPQAAPLTDSRKMAAASLAVKVALAELSPNDKPALPAPAKSAKPRARGKGKK